MSTNAYDAGGGPMRGAIRYAALMLLGLILGLPLGTHFGHRSFDRGNEIFSDVLALSEYETLAGIQYKEADFPHAKLALLDLLKFMDEMEKNNRIELQRSADVDRGIAYMRLAFLAEKAGNTLESTDCIHKAQAVLNKRDGSEQSERHLRDQVSRYDTTPTYKLPSLYLLSRKM